MIPEIAAVCPVLVRATCITIFLLLSLSALWTDDSVRRHADLTEIRTNRQSEIIVLTSHISENRFYGKLEKFSQPAQILVCGKVTCPAFSTATSALPSLPPSKSHHSSLSARVGSPYTEICWRIFLESMFSCFVGPSLTLCPLFSGLGWNLPNTLKTCRKPKDILSEPPESRKYNSRVGQIIRISAYQNCRASRKEAAGWISEGSP